MLNVDQLVGYVELNCRQDVFWLETIGRTGLQQLAPVLGGLQLRRLRVARSTAVGMTVVRDSGTTTELDPLGRTEVRCVRSLHLEAQLTGDDFLVLDDRIAIGLAFDDHNRFIFARRGGPSLLNRYQFIRDAWWPLADRRALEQR